MHTTTKYYAYNDKILCIQRQTNLTSRCIERIMKLRKLGWRTPMLYQAPVPVGALN